MLLIGLGAIFGILVGISVTLIKILEVLKCATAPSVEEKEPSQPTKSASTQEKKERPIVFVVECGTCGKTIDSPPVGSILDGKETVTSYTCEHCGSTVSVTE